MAALKPDGAAAAEIETRLSARRQDGPDRPLRDLGIGLATADDVHVQNRFAQADVEVRGGVQVADELVLPALESLREDLTVQSDRALVHAARGRQEHPHRGLRLLLEEAAERSRRHHRLREAVRDLEHGVDAAASDATARLRVRPLGQTPEHVAEQSVAAVDGPVESGPTDGELASKPLHVDRALPHEMTACASHDRFVRDHAQVVRHVCTANLPASTNVGLVLLIRLAQLLAGCASLHPRDSDTESALRLLAAEQAALRRVATLVASAPAPDRVFHAVAEEAGRLLDARTAATVRFEEQGGVVVGSWEEEGTDSLAVGTHVPYSDPNVSIYVASQHGGRIDDYTDVPGEAARMTREAGYLSSVVAPIVAGGRTWGALFVFSARPRHFGTDAERRLGDFTELVALALESVEAYEQLSASRARIVEAGISERRRLERNLHDGAQQRLVSLALQLRLAQQTIEKNPAEGSALLGSAADELNHALEELRELARGLHPAILTDRGLQAAFESLATRAPFPVEIAGVPTRRLNEGVEAALYYVVAESLTNAAKYADPASARIVMSTTGDVAAVEVHDDGRGGASRDAGSGLRGLADRVEALGGRFDVRSPIGVGTVVRAQLPLR